MFLVLVVLCVNFTVLAFRVLMSVLHKNRAPVKWGDISLTNRRTISWQYVLHKWTFCLFKTLVTFDVAFCMFVTPASAKSKNHALISIIKFRCKLYVITFAWDSKFALCRYSSFTPGRCITYFKYMLYIMTGASWTPRSTWQSSSRFYREMVRSFRGHSTREQVCQFPWTEAN